MIGPRARVLLIGEELGQRPLLGGRGHGEQSHAHFERGINRALIEFGPGLHGRTSCEAHGLRGDHWRCNAIRRSRETER